MAAETVLPATSMTKAHLYLKLAELTYKVRLMAMAKAAAMTQIMCGSFLSYRVIFRRRSCFYNCFCCGSGPTQAVSRLFREEQSSKVLLMLRLAFLLLLLAGDAAGEAVPPWTFRPFREDHGASILRFVELCSMHGQRCEPISGYESSTPSIRCASWRVYASPSPGSHRAHRRCVRCPLQGCNQFKGR